MSIRPKPKYVLCPGHVISRNDGQRHYIGAHHLAVLYGVNPRECLIHDPTPQWTVSNFRNAEEEQKGLIRLHPRDDGDYRLPEVKP